MTIDIRKAMPTQLADVLQPGAGFSFRYGSDPVGADLSADGSCETVGGRTTTAFVHPSGLKVKRELRVFAKADAIEYRLIFKNESTKTLAPLTAIHALNISVTPKFAQASYVLSSGGGVADGMLPPKTFALRKQYFAPGIVDGAGVELDSGGGRSSDKDLPFFFIHSDTQQKGLFVAIGWSGQWAALVQRMPDTGALNVRGKIPNLEIALEPGESIEGPTVLLGLYDGALENGVNRLRRLIYEEYTPKLGGKNFLPIATYDTILNVEGEMFDEALLKRLAVGAAEVGHEYFLLDAGWYQGTHWFASTGNWSNVEKSRLPNGLGPVAEAMRAAGIKFGLWFEPERVAEGSLLANEHPEWVLWDYGEANWPWLVNVPWAQDLMADNKEYAGTRCGLLDYSLPAVQNWVCEMLGHYIRTYDIKYIRYDFNIEPLPYWQATDRPGRRGVKQLRHIQGFYAIIDTIREQHPETVLEGCASGGRRIDLATARRFHTAWISDYIIDPANVRFQLHGLNHFLPANYAYSLYIAHARSRPPLQADDLGLQSYFAGSLGIGGRVDEWPPERKRQARLHMETWKKLRRYLVEDYYLLSTQPAELRCWSGWQFHDPKDQSGFVQTFRTNTGDTMHRFVVHGLDANRRYRFTDAYNSESFEIDGAAAMAEGIEVIQQPMSSRVLTYQTVSR